MQFEHDSFWDVKSQERQQLDSWRADLERKRRLLGICDAALKMLDSEGYKEFSEAAQGLMGEAVQAQAQADNPYTVMKLAGEVVCWQKVMSILQRTAQTREGLASEIEALENHLKKVVLARETEHGQEERVLPGGI